MTSFSIDKLIGGLKFPKSLDRFLMKSIEKNDTTKLVLLGAAGINLFYISTCYSLSSSFHKSLGYDLIWFDLKPFIVGLTGVVLLNQAIGTNPIGRTIELFSIFFKQESKRKINVNEMIEGYNTLHDDKFVTWFNLIISYLTPFSIPSHQILLNMNFILFYKLSSLL